MKTGPTINRGQSKQTYATPPDFMAAVVSRFGQPAYDLAADATNAKASQFFREEQDSLKQDWHLLDGLCWLNPPFANITPWAQKCYWDALYACGSIQILFLVPASVGSNWFRDYVFRKSRVYFLNGRISFDGINGFPKDCMLCHYGVTPGEEIWRWR